MERKDFKVGQVCETENGNLYVVIEVRTGEVDFLNIKTLNSIYLDNDDLVLGKGEDGKKIVKVYEYDAVPQRNRVSAALREGVGFGTKYEKVEVWSDNKLTDADIAHLKEMRDELDRLIRKGSR